MNARMPKNRRTGAVTVEFAVSAVILFLVIAVSIEFSRMNMIRHSVDNAAYEAARAGIVLGADENEIESSAHAIMSSVYANNVQVSLNPPVINDDTEEIVVTVTVPADSNGYISGKFFKGKTFVGQCRLSRDDV